MLDIVLPLLNSAGYSQDISHILRSTSSIPSGLPPRCIPSMVMCKHQSRAAAFLYSLPLALDTCFDREKRDTSRDTNYVYKLRVQRINSTECTEGSCKKRPCGQWLYGLGFSYLCFGYSAESSALGLH